MADKLIEHATCEPLTTQANEIAKVGWQHAAYSEGRVGRHLEIQDVILRQEQVEDVALEEFHARTEVKTDECSAAEAPPAGIALVLGCSLLQYRDLRALIVRCAE